MDFAAAPSLEVQIMLLLLLVLDKKMYHQMRIQNTVDGPKLKVTRPRSAKSTGFFAILGPIDGANKVTLEYVGRT